METANKTRHVPAAALAIVLLGAVLCGSGCYSPGDSQRYFRQAAANDPALEPLYQTALYTVYFDHALRRCVLHSAHTWGQHGGGGGGTGVGVSAFRCDPVRIKARVAQLNMKIEDIRDPDAPRVSDRPPQPAGTPRPGTTSPTTGGEPVPAGGADAPPPPSNP